MENVKKWSVTYTKHVKQKRKVYQDGLLHLLSNNKVTLHDECEQLLDSKFLTKDEVVTPGESLTFSSYLVDIGDPDNNSNPISNSNLKSESDNKPQEKTLAPQLERTRNTSNIRKPNTAGRKTSLISLSPSQKIIREFKKNEVLKYGAQSPTSPATPASKEWEALYTKQITQKAKKYHDGFIRMIICGSQGRQIILYDSSKNQIDKRFLKKDEVISSGESLTFDAHLVDIGDPIGTNEGDADVKIEEKNCSTTEKSKIAGPQWQKLSSGNLVSHAKRMKESTPITCRKDLGSGTTAVKGQPREGVCSNECADSSAGNFGFDKVKQNKKVASHMSLRDVNQILSIMKKPIAQDNISAVGGDSPVEQFNSRSSELLHLDDDSQTFDDSLQADRCQVINAVDKHNVQKAVDGEHNRTCSEGNGPQSEATYIDSAASPVNADYSINSVESAVSTQRMKILGSNAFESPCKSQSSIDHGKSVVLESSKEASFIDSGLSVSSEATIHHKTSTNLPAKDPRSREKAASTFHMSGPQGFDDNLAVMKMKKATKTDKSTATSDCPSFDLGI
ncbi:uncharacterized protein LOC104908199 isoform X1 [Beta vulgaris subsp. vulgaris]|uniref:uncharacterized protein LOC104908199 isoform X1 n=1 Tax=Beta vulgaris subsp. vulgaris TaxID=3555 RepID=UPI0020375253|nr:uncharacterized protein LOC104908199 isoform X1 [Beta vulgaris subsp. vulgaris]